MSIKSIKFLINFLANISFLFILLSTNGLCADPTDTPKYETRYFTQPVDHFNFQNQDKFKQKVLVNFDYWRDPENLEPSPNPTGNSQNPSGPIFFYTGNEGPIEAFADNSGFIFELAKVFRAGLVFAEHRYYGVSLPYGEEDSFSQDKIGHLSTDQALADFADILIGYKPNKVIAFGGSYGGMLAGYIRLKYPHLVFGALSASSPIKWIHFPVVSSQSSPVCVDDFAENFKSDSDFKISGNFFTAVTDDYTNFSPECTAKLKAGFDKISFLIRNEKFDELVSETKQCHPKFFIGKDDAMHIAEWLRNIFVTMAMMDYPYETSFMWPLPKWPVDVACKKALHENLAPFDAVMQAITVAYNNTEQDCYDAFKDYVHCADPTGCGLGLSAVAWDYQACTEIYLPTQSDYYSDMFVKSSWNSTIRNDYCLKKYNVIPNNNKLKISYSLLEDATRIIFSNGGKDPWGPGGLSAEDYFIDQGERGREMYSFLIPSGAHHLDLRGSHEGDPEDVIKVRAAYVEILKKWLS